MRGTKNKEEVVHDLNVKLKKIVTRNRECRRHVFEL